MGLCLGKTASSSPWPHLPPEIAGLILACLPSHDDRISFGAVCRNWRFAAQQQRPILPPAMPCISLGGGVYQSIADGKVRRTGRGVVSFGSRLMYEHHGQIYLRNPSSLSVIKIPRHYHRCTDGCDDGGAHDPCATAEALRLIGAAGIGNAMHKVVVCSSSLVAAIVYPAAGRSDAGFSFAFFRPGATSQPSWAICTPVHHYKDMVLYREKIFALSFYEGLFVHELGQPCHVERIIKNSPPPPPGIYTLGVIPVVKHYMLVSSDGRKLLMARWNLTSGSQMNLQVFEADLERREWTEVKDLDGQVLFLSKTCSRALAGSSTELYDEGFRGGNRVFILGIDWAREQARIHNSVDGVPSYCVYDMMSGKLYLVSLGRVPPTMRKPTSEWFFPSE
ncbi:hypothetical protein ACQ4PT_038893 [Festuca glaucescens]